MGRIVRSSIFLGAFAFFFVVGCESGTKKIVPKDTEANADSDQLLDDEDGLLGDEDGLISDETGDEKEKDGDETGDGDKLGKDDGMAGDKDTVVPDADVVPETCGNGMVDEGELCDGSNGTVIDCVEIDPLLYSGGKASCLDTCLGWDTVTCDEIAHECGNDIVEGPEVCDTAGLTDCVEIDPAKYSAGKAYCLDDCSGYDTVTCEEIVVDEDAVADEDVEPDTADVQPDGDVTDDFAPDANDVYPDLDTVDDWIPDTVDVQPDPDTADIDFAEADVLPDNDTAVPCGSARFDGSTGYIEVAHAAALDLSGNWTIEAWVNQDTDSAQAPIVRKGATTTYPTYYLYGANYGVPYGGYYYNGTGGYYSVSGGTEPANGEWYHIAFVKDGSTLTIFINGVPGTGAAVSGDPYANSESLFFGSRRSSTPSYFDGLIDEIRISNVARYTTSFTPQERFTSDANTVGLWHFEETSGTVANNAAGAALNGTLIGGVTWEADCAAGGAIVTPDDDAMPDADSNPGGNYALSFDGGGDYVSVAGSASLDLQTEWTIEAWARPATTGSTDVLLRKGDVGTSIAAYFLYAESGGQVYGGFYDGSSTHVLYGTLPSAGVWHHYALVRSPSTLYLFIDGTLGGSTTVTGYAEAANTAALIIGGNLSGSSYHNGLIDEVRLSSVARYTADFTPEQIFDGDSDTVALWHFDEGSGTTVYDDVSGLTGALYGNTFFELQ